MSARKSTHRKPVKASNIIKTINPNQDYEVKTIGPLLPKWATKKVKNSKGKIVKKYHMKANESSVWVNWVDQFADKYAKNADGFNVAKWSAEPRENLDGAKELLEAALTKKQVWPWPQKDDEGYDDKVAALKKLGYREWKNKSTSGKSQRWRVTHEEAMPETTTEVEDDSDETDNQTEEEEEEDEV